MHLNEGGTPEQITKAITSLADAFQCTVPDEDGLLLYVAALSDLPYTCLRQGLMQVVRTHTYNRLPFPAEIRSAAAASCAELKFWQRNVKRAITLLERQP